MRILGCVLSLTILSLGARAESPAEGCKGDAVRAAYVHYLQKVPSSILSEDIVFGHQVTALSASSTGSNWIVEVWADIDDEVGAPADPGYIFKLKLGPESCQLLKLEASPMS